MHIEHERMNDVFEKFHLKGPWPFNAVLHHFTEPDLGDPHDHPWGFRSIILSGGYVERVFQVDGSSELILRMRGDSFEIAATHIHRLEQLVTGDCWTLVIPEPGNRETRFWQFRDDGAYWRPWHSQEWRK